MRRNLRSRSGSLTRSRSSQSPRRRPDTSILARVDTLAFEHHLTSPQGHGRVPDGDVTVIAEGGACGDQIRFSVATDGERVTDAGFDAVGCGATTAAGSAAVTLVRGRHLLDAARIGAAAIADELGGLS